MFLKPQADGAAFHKYVNAKKTELVEAGADKRSIYLIDKRAKDRPEREPGAGVVCVDLQVAAEKLVWETHELASEDEIAAYHAASEERRLAIEAEELKRRPAVRFIQESPADSAPKRRTKPASGGKSEE